MTTYEPGRFGLNDLGKRFIIRAEIQIAQLPSHNFTLRIEGTLTHLTAAVNVAGESFTSYIFSNVVGNSFPHDLSKDITGFDGIEYSLDDPQIQFAAEKPTLDEFLTRVVNDVIEGR
jgi:hypothetical protein